MSDSWYDTAQICINGHVINSMTRFASQRNSSFCQKCGAPTITNCQECGDDIRGYYHVSGVIDLGSNYILPSFCQNCGKPYPWTAAKLKEAQEFSDELDNLSLEEREILKKSIDDIIRDRNTTVSANRYKMFAAKAGKSAADGLWFIIRDLVSETAKKIIMGS